MKKKVIIITGASKGLGKELALNLSKKYNSKASFVLCARTLDLLKATQKKVKQNKSKCIIVCADITKDKDNYQIILQTIKHYQIITHIVLNAGVSMWSSFADIPKINTIKKIMDTNYFGPASLLYHALPYLRESKGQVISISSLQGFISMPKHSAYSASKHALHGLLDSIELEEQNITFSKSILGWVRGTEIRENRLIENIPRKTPQKPSKKTNNLFSVSSSQCAEKISHLFEKPQRNLFVPSILKLAVILHFFCYSLLKKLLLIVIKSEKESL